MAEGKNHPSMKRRSMSIGENILIGSKSSIFSFTKGKGGILKLTETKTPINIQRYFSLRRWILRHVLDDRAEKRIVRFGADGQLRGQYFDERLGDANSLATSQRMEIPPSSPSKKKSFLLSYNRN
jgi:hypothetical protein